MKGFPGVSITRIKNYQPKRGKYLGWYISYAYYKARIRIGGKSVFLGHFATAEAAAEAYRKAKAKRNSHSPRRVDPRSHHKEGSVMGDPNKPNPNDPHDPNKPPPPR